MIALLALGYSINLLTLLALVLGIGLVVDDAIVVVENIHRHIEDGMTPVRRGDQGRARDRAADHRHDDHAGGGLCADRLCSGVTGALFREFAFTLAGAVIVSGFIALTLSPMMCSKLLKHQTGEGDGFAAFPRSHFRPPAPRLSAPAAQHVELPRADRADPASACWR